MKKKLSKKLNLKKELVSNLSNDNQRKIKGGEDLTFECETKEKESCSVFIVCCEPPEKQAGKG